MNEELYEKINSKLNQCIGMMTVPAVQNLYPHAKEVHTLLLEIANTIDDAINE